MSGLPRLSLFGDKPIFPEAKPTGNLYRPSIDRFLGYSRVFYQNKRYTDDGDLCRMLELRLAEFHGVERAICVVSGFWGLILAISSLALPRRDEIVTPALGYRRTDDSIAWAGYVPHFCDVDPETLGISVNTIKAALNDRTALILAPHPMVNCCDAKGIEEFGREHGIPVVFDSVEAAYRKYDNRRIGGFGDAEVFSTHATKLLNSFEGGYITTNDSKLADRLDRMKRYGLVCGGTVSDGHALNAKLNEVHAAMALASLDEVDEQVAAHRRKYRLYAAGIRDIEGLALLEHNESERPDYRLIVVRIGDSWPLSREVTLRLLEAENVLARPYYAPLTHRVVAYPRVCPELRVTEGIFRDFVVLPSGAHVSEDDIEKIVDILANIRRHGSELKGGGKKE
jgi:dTDP-4-amino-4,6-dideoxygalactose transaminase